MAGIGAGGEAAFVAGAVQLFEQALAMEAPELETAAVAAAVGAEKLAGAVQRAFAEAADPDIAAGAFVAPWPWNWLSLNWPT